MCVCVCRMQDQRERENAGLNIYILTLGGLMTAQKEGDKKRERGRCGSHRSAVSVWQSAVGGGAKSAELVGLGKGGEKLLKGNSGKCLSVLGFLKF